MSILSVKIDKENPQSHSENIENPLENRNDGTSPLLIIFTDESLWSFMGQVCFDVDSVGGGGKGHLQYNIGCSI